MVFFIIVLLLWGLGLFFLRPKPDDLYQKISSRRESFKEVQATFWLGIVLCCVFFICSDQNFEHINENWFFILGINNIELFSINGLCQTFSSNFIHIDTMHLLLNLSFLGLLSLYERNVGGKRFLDIFIFTGVCSSISILFISDPIISGGASAGLFGLGGAYFLDKSGLKPKEYAQGIVMILLMYMVTKIGINSNSIKNYHVDEWGHILGLILGVVYCKIIPIKKL